MRAVFIDSVNRKIEAIEVNGLADLQAAVGGYIEMAFEMDTGDTVFCNDDGLAKFDDFVSFEGAPNPFAGNCIVVGPEDRDGDSTDCLYTAADIEKRVCFMTRFQVLAYLDSNRAYGRVGGFMREI